MDENFWTTTKIFVSSSNFGAPIGWPEASQPMSACGSGSSDHFLQRILGWVGGLSRLCCLGYLTYVCVAGSKRGGCRGLSFFLE